jgi:hypothetical protein
LEQVLTNYFQRQKEHNDYVSFGVEMKESTDSKILVSVTVSGAAGGNCWDDSPAQYFSNDQDEILHDLHSEIADQFYTIKKDFEMEEKHFKAVIEKLARNAYDEGSIGETCDSEYYGNYTDKNIFSLNMGDFFKEFLDEESFKFFTSFLKNYTKDEDVLFEKKQLKARKDSVESRLAGYDSERMNRKNRIENDILSLQKALKGFDEETIMQKTIMEQELATVNKELSQEKYTKFN